MAWLQLRRTLALHLVVCLGTCIVAKAEDKIVSVHVKHHVGDWIVQELTGRVFCAVPYEHRVVEYDSNGKELRQFSVSGEPRRMTIKGDRLVVGCTKPVSLTVIDLKANKVGQSATIGGTEMLTVFCSRADNNFAYCAYKRQPGWTGSALVQVDLETLKVRAQIDTGHWSLSHPTLYVMSHDGRRAATARGNNSSSQDVGVLKVDESMGWFTDDGVLHRSTSGNANKPPELVHAGPHSRYWVLDSLRSRTLREKLRHIGGEVRAIHPDRDLIARSGMAQVSLEQLTVESKPTRISMPRPREFPTRKELWRTRFTLQFDLRNNMLFYAVNDSGYWIDLQPHLFRYPVRPVILTPSEVTAVVGTESRVQVQVQNKPPGSRLKIQSTGIDARLEADSIVLRPELRESSEANVVMTLLDQNDKQIDELRMLVHLEVPRVDFDFKATHIKLSPNKKFAVIWGDQIEGDSDSNREKMAVVDLNKRQVIGTRSFERGIQHVMIDDDHVLVIPAPGDRVLRLDHGLGDGKGVRVKDGSRLSRPLWLPKGWLLLSDKQKLNTATMTVHPAVPSEGVWYNGIVSPHDGYIKVHNSFYSQQTGEVVRLGTSGLPLLGLTPDAKLNLATYSANHARRMNGEKLQSRAGIVKELPTGSTVISRKWPAVLLVQRGMMGVFNLHDGSEVYRGFFGRGSRRDLSFGLQNIVTRKRGEKAPKWVWRTNRRSSAQVVARDDELLVLNHDLRIVPLPVEVMKQLPEPAYFTIPQTIEIEVDGKVSFPLKTRGKTVGASFELRQELNGISLNERTGEVTVDTNLLWDDFATLRDKLNRTARRGIRGFDRAANARSYKLATGKELPEGKLSAIIPIDARLTTPDKEMDETTFLVVLAGPENP